MLFDDKTYIKIDGKIQRLRNNPSPKGVGRLGGTGIGSETESIGCFMRLIRRIK